MKLLAVGFALAVCCVSPALAQNCAQKLVSFELIQDSFGNLLIPVSINGADRLMALDPDKADSAIYQSDANDLHLQIKPLRDSIEIVRNAQNISDVAVIPLFKIGSLWEKNKSILVIPRRDVSDPRIAGWIALDILSQVDVDIDFPNSKISLLSRNHCSEKQLVYWTDAFSVLPIEIQRSGNYTFIGKLDGQDIHLAIATNTEIGSVILSTASRLFGLSTSSDGMMLVQPSEFSGPFDTYNYTFHSIAIGNVQLEKPMMHIYDDIKTSACKASHSCYGAEAVGAIALSQLNGLHIYINYQGKKILLSRPIQ